MARSVDYVAVNFPLQPFRLCPAPDDLICISAALEFDSTLLRNIDRVRAITGYPNH